MHTPNQIWAGGDGKQRLPDSSVVFFVLTRQVHQRSGRSAKRAAFRSWLFNPGPNQQRRLLVPENTEAAAVRNKTQAAARDHVAFSSGFLRDRLDFRAGADRVRKAVFKALYCAAAPVQLNTAPREVWNVPVQNQPESLDS